MKEANSAILTIIYAQIIVTIKFYNARENLMRSMKIIEICFIC